MARPRRIEPRDVAEFWAHVDRSAGQDGCWPWIPPSGKGTPKRGSFKLEQRSEPAARIAFRLLRGPIPDVVIGHDGAVERAVLCHDCPEGDYEPCCNPWHFFIGTPGDNARDASRKGMLIRQKHEMICAHCGRRFDGYPQARFCSGACRVAAHRLRHPGERRAATSPSERGTG